MCECRNRSGSFGISSMIKDINICIKDLDKYKECQHISEYENLIKHVRYQISCIIKNIKESDPQNSTIQSKDDLKRSIFHIQMEAELEETKIDHLRKEWIQQQHALAKLQDCLFRKTKILALHSSYCSTQGYALCALIAILMDEQGVINSLLTDDSKYLLSFMEIAYSFLSSFVRTYTKDPPLEDSVDYKFVLSLYTCISYLSTNEEGLNFLITRNECQIMLRGIIEVLSEIQYTTTVSLRIILWKILHNVSGQATGIPFLQSCKSLLATIDICINDDYNSTIYKCALEILERISKDIPNKEYLENCNKWINENRLNELSCVSYQATCHLPSRILRNLQRAAYTIAIKEREAQGDITTKGKTNPITCKCPTKSKKTSKLSKKNKKHKPKRKQKDICEEQSTCCSASSLLGKKQQGNSLKEMFQAALSTISNNVPTFTANQNNTPSYACSSYASTENRIDKQSSNKTFKKSSYYKSYETDCCNNATKQVVSYCLPHNLQTPSNQLLNSDSEIVKNVMISKKFNEESSQSCCANSRTQSSTDYNKCFNTCFVSDIKSPFWNIHRVSNSLPTSKLPSQFERERQFLSDKLIKNLNSSINSIKSNTTVFKQKFSLLDAVTTPEKKESEELNIPIHDKEDEFYTTDSSINSDEEGEICTCGSKSEKTIIPWAPENRMVVLLAETDRRVARVSPNKIRITSTVLNPTRRNNQRIVNKITIPGSAFQHIRRIDNKEEVINNNT